VYDAVVVLGGASAAVLAESGLAIHFVNEAYRHGKPIAAVGNGALLLDVCSLGEANAKEGLVIGDDAEAGSGPDYCLAAASVPPQIHCTRPGVS
jgi:catalase